MYVPKDNHVPIISYDYIAGFYGVGIQITA